MKVPLKNSHCRQGDKGHREEASREGPVDWQLAAHPSSQSKRPLLLRTCPFLAPNSQRDELGQHPVPNMNTHTAGQATTRSINAARASKMWMHQIFILNLTWRSRLRPRAPGPHFASLSFAQLASLPAHLPLFAHSLALCCSVCFHYYV